MIPGSEQTSYGGAALTDDGVAEMVTIATINYSIRDHTGSAVRASGQLFQVSVNTYGTLTSAVTGFDLLYNQVPCAGTGNAVD